MEKQLEYVIPSKAKYLVKPLLYKLHIHTHTQRERENVNYYLHFRIRLKIPVIGPVAQAQLVRTRALNNKVSGSIPAWDGELWPPPPQLD